MRPGVGSVDTYTHVQVSTLPGTRREHFYPYPALLEPPDACEKINPNGLLMSVKIATLEEWIGCTRVINIDQTSSEKYSFEGPY